MPPLEYGIYDGFRDESNPRRFAMLKATQKLYSHRKSIGNVVFGSGASAAAAKVGSWFKTPTNTITAQNNEMVQMPDDRHLHKWDRSDGRPELKQTACNSGTVLYGSEVSFFEDDPLCYTFGLVGQGDDRHERDGRRIHITKIWVDYTVQPIPAANVSCLGMTSRVIIVVDKQCNDTGVMNLNDLFVPDGKGGSMRPFDPVHEDRFQILHDSHYTHHHLPSYANSRQRRHRFTGWIDVDVEQIYTDGAATFVNIERGKIYAWFLSNGADLNEGCDVIGNGRDVTAAEPRWAVQYRDV
jgi:hypothetical protein